MWHPLFRATFATQSALGSSLKRYGHQPPQQWMLFDNNTKGLSTIYNRTIEHAQEIPAILVFIHDNLSIRDFFGIGRIYEAVKQFDIAILAGSTRRIPHQPSSALTPEMKWARREFPRGGARPASPTNRPAC
ncbi:hypothetical protein WL05_07155 [Burkholderia ubonensis]|nr:hypothetical protein WJ51_21445 [Burkholderia ubonensis]KVM15478.1 hypothetical protein WJ52_14965 [Burkholderia ubonensis]KVM53648.1 hypothetical protein WJ56_00565 [Burkholderia ubonensis]KVR13384.1 hypothetical protein WK11_31330 [Burkholderia ubonensis]KVX55200.1 hypothetical protein WL05_07155 [Burkholderia ubonensis]